MFDRMVVNRLDQVIDLLRIQNSLLVKLLKVEITEMSALDDLVASVEKNTSVDQAAVEAIQGLAALLAEAVANADVAKIAALSAQINASADALAAAIPANTEAAPPA